MGLVATTKGPAPPHVLPRLALLGALALACLGGAVSPGCSKAAAPASVDASGDASDGAGSETLPACTDDGGAGDAAASEAGVATDLDEFGPHAPVAKMVSSIGRVNIYAAASPRMLDRIDVYLGSALGETRLTIAVQEAASMTTPFQKVFDAQLDFGACEGWATSGPVAIPLIAGRYYAIGFDPNQPVTAFVSTDANALPIDGAFGRLVSSKTTTSVSLSGLTWDKATAAEFNRQRLATSPRSADQRDVVGAGTGGAGGGGGTSDGGAADATGDGSRG